MMQPQAMQGAFLSPSEYVPGMSDEEEIRRMGATFVEADGLGEVLYEQDLSELGIRPE